MRVVAEVIITLALLLSTGFGGAVYAKELESDSVPVKKSAGDRDPGHKKHSERKNNCSQSE